MDPRDVVDAWDDAGPGSTHPSRGVSEDAYRQSGEAQAALLAEDLTTHAEVVDFGAGDGRIAIPLHDLGLDVTAVDSSPRMLAALNATEPDIVTVLSDGTDLATLLPGDADAAICIAVLIHHSYASARRIIEALRDVVKPGGYLFLDWPTSAEPAEGQVWTDVTTWSPNAQAAVARELGLTRIDVRRPWQVYRKDPGA